MVDKELVDKLFDGAKAILLEDGELDPTGFICKGDRIEIVPLKFDEDKYVNLAKAGGLARLMEADHLITVVDAAARQLNEEQAKYVTENPETEAPLCYPKSMRIECVVIQILEFSTRKSSAIMMEYTGEHPDFQFKEHSEPFDGEGALKDACLHGWDLINTKLKGD